MCNVSDIFSVRYCHMSLLSGSSARKSILQYGYSPSVLKQGSQMADSNSGIKDCFAIFSGRTAANICLGPRFTFFGQTVVITGPPLANASNRSGQKLSKSLRQAS